MQMGSNADFTDEERKKLAEVKEKAFRPRVESLLEHDYTKTDLYLIRWLRARELNLDKAEGMLQHHMKWRKENKIDLLLQEPADDYFTKNYPLWLNGVDLHGQPVLCSPVGEWDIRRVVEEDRISEFEDYVNRMFERVLDAIRRCDARKAPDQPPITQFTLILNWDNFSVRQTANMKAIQTLLNISATYEAHYPEILSKAFFLNTNPVFQIVFALMRNILAPRTLSKITCYGTDRNEWEPAVRSVVEEHQIPRQFGG